MESTAGAFSLIHARGQFVKRDTRELVEPHKLLTYLLQSRVLNLDPETIAVYLQAALKIFGVWTAELADRWDNDDLPKVRQMVDTIIDRISDFVSNQDIEVQERVRVPQAYPL